MFRQWIEGAIIRMKRDGSELVIISDIGDQNSTIFWFEEGSIYSFTRALGIMKRTDMTVERLTEHLMNMHDECAQIFIRG